MGEAHGECQFYRKRSSLPSHHHPCDLVPLVPLLPLPYCGLIAICEGIVGSVWLHGGQSEMVTLSTSGMFLRIRSASFFETPRIFSRTLLPNTAPVGERGSST